MEEVLGIFGEVDHSDLLHKAQTIKGNQAGTLHVWFPYSISLRGGGQSFDANAEGTAPLTTGKTGKGGIAYINSTKK